MNDQYLSQNIDYVHGDTARFRGTVLQDGALVDPTGCTFWFTVKELPTDADNAAVYQLTSTGGAITIVDAANGEILVTIPSNQTYNPAWAYADTVYWYDLQMKDTSNNISTLAKGRVTVFTDITRETS